MRFSVKRRRIAAVLQMLLNIRVKGSNHNGPGVGNSEALSSIAI